MSSDLGRIVGLFVTQNKQDTALVVIGIVAPSSRVPQVELKLGVELLEKEGFEIRAHRQCSRHHRYFAGTDGERAQALIDYALRSLDRGHLVVRAEVMVQAGFCHFFGRWQRGKNIPRNKLFLIGYSDATAIFEIRAQRVGMVRSSRARCRGD